VERVVLDGSVNYLLSSPVLDAIGFLSHKSLKVLLCKYGHGAFIPEAAPGHAQNTHGMTITDINRQALITYCEDNDIRKDLRPKAPMFAILPAPRGPPVQQVEHREGFACSLCTYCCCSKPWMDTHIRTKHKDMHRQVSKSYYRTTVQTLFSHFAREYFQVDPRLTNLPLQDPIDHLLRVYIPGLPGPSVTLPDTDRERTPFMRFMNWDQHLSHIQTDKSRFSLLLSLQQPLTPEEGHLSRLATAVQEYIRLGMRISLQHDQSFSVLKSLVHGRNTPSEQ